MEWDYTYSGDTIRRFNEATADEQLEILKKWYPVGMTCKRLNRSSLRGTTKSYETNNEYEITGYSLSGAIYNVVVRYGTTIKNGGRKSEFKSDTKIHPVFLSPNDNWKRKTDRDDKLRGLLDE